MRQADRSANAERREFIAEELLAGMAPDLDLVDFEREVQRELQQIGATMLRRKFEDEAPTERFEESGRVWRPAVSSNLRILTLFGPVTVSRTLFRSRRNGKTRCVLSERLGLVDGLWTQNAAKIGALVIAEMPMERAEDLLAQVGVAQASRSSLLRLGGTLFDMWETDRAAHEKSMRAELVIPAEAVAVAVSLDGVMVTLIGANRASLKAAARERGVIDKGPTGWAEASVGVITFYDAHGRRVGTRRYARMPEQNKETTKSWLRAELEHIRCERPDLRVVAIADGAANNWSFLETLCADHEVVDFFHTAEHLSRHVGGRSGVTTAAKHRKLRVLRRTLLHQPAGADVVFQRVLRRQNPGTQPTFFERHHKRMAYAELRQANLPIGSGVTESTCKLAVCDRLRRTGMRWSIAGGQAILTLRTHRINGEFDRAWERLIAENQVRMAA